ncbi:class I SAM-dependent methyltransferase [Lapidilactobacillus gannanensis]|jgi:16S rRNA (guanine1207-N2)-methyltransferase|uniref:Class I SAM-dependent methyltransferase n=1 Tax=Lapidilactobacillus gannanensis TaxID=2486002 RepID=A0ABW4BNK1_9LACO|nr:class I SAM-dependent methyltransferase [Lapidilactobacillus gannanensis]MCH4056539.1 class I SAM-dependent methyltransferase [Lactobacillaceae bacterium]
MSHQYFEDNQDLAHQRETFSFELLGHQLQLTTDAGVFSRERVDYGSVVLLNAVAPFLPSGQPFKLLDLGCGYGPIGLSIAKAYPQAVVTLVDVNQRALDLAQENATANQVTDQVNIFASDGYQAITAQDYDFILTNPPIRAGKTVVQRLLSESIQYLKPQGQFFAVMQKKQGAPSALKLLQSVYDQAEIVKRDKGYYILQGLNL